MVIVPMKSLVKVLRSAGKPTATYRTPDGSRVLLLPFGGRVLGLFGPKSGRNFYWTNPALHQVKTAQAFFKQTAWHNSGGDRSWLAPEVDLFLPDYPKLDRYKPQAALDPGAYRLKNVRGDLALESRLNVRLSRLERSVVLDITKRFGPALNPLRYEHGLDFPDVEFAGYTQHTSLTWVSSRPPSAAVGLWNLIQMPHGGDLLIPTYSRNDPQRVFSTVGQIESKDLQVTDHMIRYRMRQKGEHKLSLRAAPTCGRAGYLVREGMEWSLVVRNFTINPSGEYVDVLWKDPSWLGFAVQACNVNSGLGQFAELEYHIPAIGSGTGQVSCQDSAQVWAFRGGRKSILAIARLLVAGNEFKV
jgi:hypothetical protein